MFVTHQLLRSGRGWALLAFGSYLARLGSSGASGVRYSSLAGMSYQAPSAKSTRALPAQLTVTTRPTFPSNRFNSGLSALAMTSRSVQVRFSSSAASQSNLGMVRISLEGVAAGRRGRVKVEPLDELTRFAGPKFAVHSPVMIFDA